MGVARQGEVLGEGAMRELWAGVSGLIGWVWQ